MKKIVTMLLVCVMVLGLFAGCGNGSTQQTTAPASGETEAQETEATPDTIVIMAPPCHRQLSGKPENLGR